VVPYHSNLGRTDIEKEIAVVCVGASEHLKPFTWLQSNHLKTAKHQSSIMYQENQKSQKFKWMFHSNQFFSAFFTASSDGLNVINALFTNSYPIKI
jgi:hypothetical protein